ncbi:hypothetical protein [Luteipulveratus mongoliensis]|uniref:Carboxypeptidase regulatory-like domain-containing protein n=1 Tax=Luteipulveratus mongoliensis TaxID=571913 RepID=A0A0K1JDP3_9MICO|nr:hypothetical protein [Luteipulveratus mongoliensis]AKU14837.1 hypothetical protein VV02_01395 [Luteipulveratus mongoliensis]
MKPDVTYADLATMWSAHDPMPDRLVDKVLVSVAMEDMDAEYELLHLVERSRELVGTRRDNDETLTIVFSGSTCSLMMRVSSLDASMRRVDGWVSPPRCVRVTVKHQDSEVSTESDSKGRFEIDRVHGGLCRMIVNDLAPDSGDDNTQNLFATPSFEL